MVAMVAASNLNTIHTITHTPFRLDDLLVAWEGIHQVIIVAEEN